MTATKPKRKRVWKAWAVVELKKRKGCTDLLDVWIGNKDIEHSDYLERMLSPSFPEAKIIRVEVREID